MAKNLVVKVAGSGTLHDIAIEPGTSTSEILSAVGLQGYLLSKGPSDPPLGEHENVFPLVQDGDKLFASTPAEAGDSDSN